MKSLPFFKFNTKKTKTKSFLQNGVQNSNGMSGDLYIEKPWPGQARTIWQDHARFVETYYKQRPG